ncbi:MAG: histidine kinase [Peptococcaceae bacterium BICA1-8]|nr:MAG: histidine kinase [Peptococcaceae bacterium BICA1-8]
MKKFKISITLLIVVTLIFGLGGISLVTYYETRKLLTADLEESISSLALSSSSEVGQWLSARKSEVELMADIPLIQSENIYDYDIITYLNKETHRNKVYEQFFTADSEGNYVLNSGGTGSISDRDYFKAAMATGNTTISDPLISRGSGNQIIVVAAPIKKDGRVVGLLGGSVNIKELNQKVTITKIGDNGYAFIVQKDGLIISHPDQAVLMKYNFLNEKDSPQELKTVTGKMTRGETGFTEYYFQGVEKYMAFAPVPGVEWSLAVTVPVSYITSQLYFLPAFFVLITVFFGVIMTVLFRQWLGVPLIRLAKITTEVTDKLEDDNEHNWFESPVSEVESLTGNFRSMVAALRTNFQQLKVINANLEEEIEERIAIQENLNRSYEELGMAEEKLRQNYRKLQVNEKALQESESRFRLMLENVQLLTMMIDKDGRISFCNDFMLELTGFKRDEVIGQDFFDLFIPIKVRNENRNRLNKLLENGELWFPLTSHIQTKNGENHLVNWNNTLLLDHSGNVIGFACIGENITERKKMEEKLVFQSLHDPLTGLFNRTYFEERLRHIEEHPIEQVGIIVCDVDGLKFVNDTLGHSMGDELLKLASSTIKKCFRKDDAVSRIGGDEFAVILPNANFSAVEQSYRKIINAVEDYNVKNSDLLLSLSLGFAVDDTRNRTISDIFKEADNNMYREKLHRSKSTRSALVHALMKALEARDFITEGHAERLQYLVVAMGKSIGISDRALVDLRLLAQFHDIGKVGVPDRILFKPAALTREEFTEMQRHCEIGHRIAQSAPDLIPIADWILKHHEWWNGEGYPLGIKGEDIPVECRILAITDAYDAMTSDRPYRKAMHHEEAIEELGRQAGIQFDPKLVPVFINIFKNHGLKE